MPRPLQKQIPSRLYSLDIARGLAAFAVVLWHWQHFFYAAPGVKSSDFARGAQPLYALLAPFYNCGALAVYFFFTLSGFVFFWLYKDKIQNKSCSFGSFCLARFSRLYPLHFITLILVLCLQLAFLWSNGDYFVFQHNDAYHFILNLFFVSHWGYEEGWSFNAPIWSVSMEIGLYLLFFSTVVAKKANWWHLTLIVAVLVLAQILQGIVIPRWHLAIETFFLGGLTYYAVNYYLSHRWRTQVSDCILILAPLCIWILMALLEPFSNFILFRYSLLTRLVFPATIFGIVLLELVTDFRFSRLKWIGDCTYSSYLLHFPLQLLIVLVLGLFSITDQTIFYSPWTLLGFFLILIPLSLMTYRQIELPLQNRIREAGRERLKLKQVGAVKRDQP